MKIELDRRRNRLILVQPQIGKHTEGLRNKEKPPLFHPWGYIPHFPWERDGVCCDRDDDDAYLFPFVTCRCFNQRRPRSSSFNWVLFNDWSLCVIGFIVFRVFLFACVLFHLQLFDLIHCGLGCLQCFLISIKDGWKTVFWFKTSQLLCPVVLSFFENGFCCIYFFSVTTRRFK